MKDIKNDKSYFINPLSNPERYSFDDMRMGYLFADTFKEISCYVPESKSWYVYDGKVWKHDIESLKVYQQGRDLTNYLNTCASKLKDDKKYEAFVRYVERFSSNRVRKTMINEARSIYPVSILEFDKNIYLFNCQNCTLNLLDFKVMEHKASDFLSKISNVVFNKDIKCDRWEKFINEIMKEDIEAARFLQKSLGYSLTGDTSKECFFILYSSTTRNGKGSTMETTLHKLGDYGRTAQPETIAKKQNVNSSNPSEDIALLKGARFVNMSEPEKGLNLNTALVKQMTGSNTMKARFLHQNSFEFKPEFKLFINTNHLPKVSDDSIFSSGRVKLIPFEKHFEENEQDKGLKAFFKQIDNISGIFNWFLEGLKLINNEGLEMPESIAKALDKYKQNSNTVKSYISECLEPCKNNNIKINIAYTHYQKWCKDNGYAIENKNKFIMELKDKNMFKRHRELSNIIPNYKIA